MLLRLGRSILETPHVVHEFAQQRLDTELALTGRTHGCDRADVILCVGCDPSESHPQFELRIKKGLRQNAQLVCLTEKPSMVGFADYQAEGKADELWSKLKKALQAREEEESGGLKMPKPRPWEAGGKTNENWDDLVEEVAKASNILVVVAGDIAQQGLGKLPEEVKELGWSSEPYGLIHLRDGVNGVGHDAVGLAAEWTEEVAKPYQQAWGTFNSKATKIKVKNSISRLPAFGNRPSARHFRELGPDITAIICAVTT